MKPIKNLFKKVYDFDNLYTAYLNARKCKRYRAEVLKFTSNLEENLIDIQNQLIYQTYEVGQYRQFIISDPKKRLIMSLPFRDRVVQWAIYLVLNPIFTMSYIEDSYGCIKTKGSHSAIQRVQYWLKEASHKPCKYYYLKMDISKFYYRVDHDVLLKILGKKLADHKMMWLLEKIINCEDTAFGLPLGLSVTDTNERLFDRGMPIGNLSSQMFANIYLNEVDQYVKRELRIHQYVRFVDDMLILSSSKQLLHEYKRLVELFLNEKLHLHLNQKTCIRPINLGIEFLGYKIWNTHIKLKKPTALRIKRRLKKLMKQYSSGEIELEKALQIVNSFYAILAHCNSYGLRKSISESFGLKRDSNI